MGLTRTLLLFDYYISSFVCRTSATMQILNTRQPDSASDLIACLLHSSGMNCNFEPGCEMLLDFMPQARLDHDVLAPILGYIMMMDMRRTSHGEY